MKLNPKYKIREMAGENVIVLPGHYGSDMTRIISLNDSSRFLWEALLDKDFTAQDAAQCLVEEYEIDPETALKDAQAWCMKLQENNLIE